MAKEDFEYRDDEDGKQHSVDIDDELEISIEDDTPEVDRNRRPLTEPVEEPTEDELSNYDEKVQKRIKSAHRKMHDERRAKEAALREREEAVSFAQRTYARNKELETQLSEGSKVYIDTVNSEANLALEAAKREYKEAYENGDSDKLVEAQEKIARAVSLKDNVSNLRPLTVKEETDYTQQQQAAQPAKLSPAAQAWVGENPWFYEDNVMRDVALRLHGTLVRKGVELDSNEYYETINAHMRQRFPEYFDDTESDSDHEVKISRNKPATVVASAKRSSAPKKVTLKQSQINLSKRLGITPEMYAIEMLKHKRQERDNG
jgi:hypothetical protein